MLGMSPPPLVGAPIVRSAAERPRKVSDHRTVDHRVHLDLSTGFTSIHDSQHVATTSGTSLPVNYRSSLTQAATFSYQPMDRFTIIGTAYFKHIDSTNVLTMPMPSQVRQNAAVGAFVYALQTFYQASPSVRLSVSLGRDLGLGPIANSVEPNFATYYNFQTTVRAF